MSGDNTIELSRRKVLGGLALIGAASATAGAGTIAALTDTENSNGNQIYAGRMDLRINGGDSSVTLLNTSNNPIVPGDSGFGCVTLKNSANSNVGGAVDVRITRVANKENGREEMEKEAGDTTGGNNGGELGEYLKVRMYFEDSSGNRTYLGDDQYRKASNRLQAGKTFQVHYPLDVSEEADFCLDWKLPASAPTTIQTDSVEVDFAFDMTQAVLGTAGTGFPSWTGDKEWDAKIRYGDGQDNGATGGAAEFAISSTQTGSHAWASGVAEPFSFSYDATAGTATIDVDGDTLTASVPAATTGRLGIIAKGANADVEVTGLELNGLSVAPGSVTSLSGSGNQHVALDGLDFSNGFELTGTVELTYSGSPSNEAGIQFDVQ
ncbi:choice-of-anchor W domain-containing protein [Haloferax profundi]|uniref:Uncharacterized protein n=1 Tax=Haloferax profundi TaxID=1544718 RepID=A0A0W1SX08_9EURY|nr:choice-of-anchor W domain-containing protein [Haloferax profundi]KTG30958.1 hypothetical protein AUR66_05360 [Haloferax profundi]